jgi:hypothetical protein
MSEGAKFFSGFLRLDLVFLSLPLQRVATHHPISAETQETWEKAPTVIQLTKANQGIFGDETGDRVSSFD